MWMCPDDVPCVLLNCGSAAKWAPAFRQSRKSLAQPQPQTWPCKTWVEFQLWVLRPSMRDTISRDARQYLKLLWMLCISQTSRVLLQL